MTNWSAEIALAKQCLKGYAGLHETASHELAQERLLEAIAWSLLSLAKSLERRETMPNVDESLLEE